MDYRKYIVRDGGVCGGEPVIRGTRVTIRTILASLGEGATLEQILRDFPTLTEDDIRAVIATERKIRIRRPDSELPCPIIAQRGRGTESVAST